jgi:Zn-dependent peptidase ImmA (M78 family)
MTDEDVREWQANRLGAALIMPADTVKMLLAERLSVHANDIKATRLSHSLIEDMAGVYNVSFSAMRIRLENLGLLFPQQ